MLPRGRKLDNLLGFTDQVENLLRRGPPLGKLRQPTDKLEAKAASTLDRLQSRPFYALEAP